MSELKLSINPDGTAKLDFSGDPIESLSADDLSVMIASLGNLRDQMKPGHPERYVPPTGQPVNVILDPAWYISNDWLSGNPVIHIRDPRFGWLGYLIPTSEALKAADLLVRNSHPPEESGTQKSN